MLAAGTFLNILPHNHLRRFSRWRPTLRHALCFSELSLWRVPKPSVHSRKGAIDGYWRKNHRNRPRNHQLGCGRDGGQGGQGHPQCRGESFDTQRRRVHRQGRNRRRRARPAAGRDQPHPHRLFDQAFHGPAPQRSGFGREDRALQGGRRAGRLRQGPRERPRLHPARDFGLHACES